MHWLIVWSTSSSFIGSMSHKCRKLIAYGRQAIVLLNRVIQQTPEIQLLLCRFVMKFWVLSLMLKIELNVWMHLVVVLILISGQRQLLLLKGVWLVPSIASNLFSSLLTHDKNSNSKFQSKVTSWCSLSVNGVPVLMGTHKKNGTLYKAEIKTVSPSSNSSVDIVKWNDPLQLYHERWSHQDKPHVK